MKMDKFAALVVKTRSVLTGSYVSHAVDTTTNGSVIEKHTVLLNSKPVEFATFIDKGIKAEDVKPPAWLGARFPVVVITNPDFVPDTWAGKGQLRCTCESIDVLEA